MDYKHFGEFFNFETYFDSILFAFRNVSQGEIQYVAAMS